MNFFLPNYKNVENSIFVVVVAIIDDTLHFWPIIVISNNNLGDVLLHSNSNSIEKRNAYTLRIRMNGYYGSDGV